MTDSGLQREDGTNLIRQLLAPDFRPGMIRKMADTVEEVVRTVCAPLQHESDLDVVKLVQEVPLRVISRLLGIDDATLARALARSVDLQFRRVQFTSDLLPSDVLGVSIYNPQTTSFEIRKGPIFTNVVVADEINRAPPRTQSGLLEAMQDGSVTIDDKTFSLPRPFLVMATQNPLEHHGTYPLPESQLDRFLMRLTIGYPHAEAERRILVESKGGSAPVDDLVLEAEGVRRRGGAGGEEGEEERERSHGRRSRAP